MEESPLAKTKITPAQQRIGPFNPADSRLWEASGRQSNLLGILDFDFGFPLEHGNRSVDLNLPTRQGFEISKFVFVGRKNHAGEGTLTIVFAEVEKSIAAPRGENLNDTSGNAARFARVRTSVVEVHASCRIAGGRKTRSQGRCLRWRTTSAATHENSQAEHCQNNRRHKYLPSPHLETFS